MSYQQLMIFLPIGSKQYNTNWRSVLIARETMLKNKPHLVIFPENILISLWTFQLTLVLLFIVSFACWDYYHFLLNWKRRLQKHSLKRRNSKIWQRNESSKYPWLSAILCKFCENFACWDYYHFLLNWKRRLQKHSLKRRNSKIWQRNECSKYPCKFCENFACWDYYHFLLNLRRRLKWLFWPLTGFIFPVR